MVPGQDGPGFFDASAPAQDAGPTAEELARRQARDDAQDRLVGLIGRLEEKATRAEAARPPASEQTIALLESVTSAPGAPAGYRAIHDKVAAGRTTWADVWAGIHEYGDVGFQLRLDVVAAKAVATSELIDRVAAQPDLRGTGRRLPLPDGWTPEDLAKGRIPPAPGTTR